MAAGGLSNNCTVLSVVRGEAAAESMVSGYLQVVKTGTARSLVERNRRYQRFVSHRGVVLVVVVLCVCVSADGLGGVVCPGACDYPT